MATGTQYMNGITPSTMSPFAVALEEFKRELRKQGTKNQVQATTLGDLKIEIDKLQTELHSRRTLQNFERLQGFLEATEQFGKVIEVYCQVHEIVAFIWGPLKFLLQVASAYMEAIGEIIGIYQKLGQILSLLKQSWELHNKDTYLESVLVDIYKSILKFHLKALYYFKKPTWKRVFHATWKTHKASFGDIIEELKEHRNVIIGNTTLAEYRSSREEREKRLIEKRGEKNEQHFKELRTWLQGGDVENDHNDLRSAQIPGTGRWLFANDQFRKWLDPRSSYSLLWLNGMPGAGKSVLASMVVDDIKANVHNYKPKPQVFYFYCKHDDKEKNNFVAIGRSLLLQLLGYDCQILEHIYTVSKDSKDAILRTRSIIKELLEASLLDLESAYIILDGIDECIVEDRDEIMQWFKNLVDNLPPAHCHRLRILFVSQNDARSRRDFSGMASLKIQQNDNRGDVAAFGNIQALKIQEKFGISDSCRQDIAERIPDSSGGIFLLAKLTCDNLLKQATREDLDVELQPNFFPTKINEAYARIMARILSHSQSEGVEQYCLMLFGWLVCAKRPLKWHEIQCAKAIDPDNQKVDLKKKKFLIDAKDLCGSLIETHGDGTIQFIHMTARWFLVEASHINLHDEHVKMTELCIEYLKFPDLRRSNERLDNYINDGYYSFMDYAMSNWLLHFESALGKTEYTVATKSISDISESLEAFINNHWAEPSKPATVAERHIAKLKPFESKPFYQRLILAFGWSRKMVYSHTSIVSAEVVLDLIDVVANVRSQIEWIWEEAQKNTTDREAMQKMYGKSIYKCHRLSCLHFSQAFPNMALRTDHNNKHERPHCCTVTGCPNSIMGFSKFKDLQKHIGNTHDHLADARNQFPAQGEKRKRSAPEPPAPITANQNAPTNTTPEPLTQTQNAVTTIQPESTAQTANIPQLSDITTLDDEMEEQSTPASPKTPEPEMPPERPRYVPRQRGPKIFECTRCSRKFEKKYNYDSHMRKHSDDKKYLCMHCQRGFARDHDRKRHEQTHRSAQYSCPSCQRMFTRSDSLHNHWRSQVGSRCLELMAHQYNVEDGDVLPV